MTPLNQEAQHLLNRYLLHVRNALAGSRSVSPSEVERDILDHIEAEFPDRVDPVSCDELEPVLTRLGSPDLWAPAEKIVWWRRTLYHLQRFGPEDWRLAYLAFGLLLAGFVVLPLLPIFVLASYCTARAAIAATLGRGEDLGPQKWMLYPPLILTSTALAVLLFLWPGPLGGAAAVYLRNHHPDTVRMILPHAHDLAEWELLIYSAAAVIGLWWTLLGVVFRRWPGMTRAIFRPFTEWFAPAHGSVLCASGIALVLGGVGGLLLGFSLHFQSSI